MTPRLQVDLTDPTPPYEQLRRQLAALIASSVLEDGTRLPPVRQLAADLDLAPGTVARTYRELQAAGLATTRRGGGTRVRRPSSPSSSRSRRAALDAYAAAYVQQAALLGVGDAEVQDAVVRLLALRKC